MWRSISVEISDFSVHKIDRTCLLYMGIEFHLNSKNLCCIGIEVICIKLSLKKFFKYLNKFSKIKVVENCFYIENRTNCFEEIFKDLSKVSASSTKLSEALNRSVNFRSACHFCSSVYSQYLSTLIVEKERY